MTNKIFNKDNVPTIAVNSPEELSSYRLIDVRTPEEFVGELSHIEGAELQTLGPQLEEFLKTAKKEEAIIFICRSGMRSAKATSDAVALGFKKVLNLEGGMMYWKNRGFKVV